MGLRLISIWPPRPRRLQLKIPADETGLLSRVHVSLAYSSKTVFDIKINVGYVWSLPSQKIQIRALRSARVKFHAYLAQNASLCANPTEDCRMSNRTNSILRRHRCTA